MSGKILHKHYTAQKIGCVPCYPTQYSTIILPTGKIYKMSESGWENLPSTHFIYTDPIEQETYHVINGSVTPLSPQDELLCTLPVSETKITYNIIPPDIDTFQLNYECEHFPEDSSDILPENRYFHIPPKCDNFSIVMSIRKGNRRIRVIHKCKRGESKDP